MFGSVHRFDFVGKIHYLRVMGCYKICMFDATFSDKKNFVGRLQVECQVAQRTLRGNGFPVSDLSLSESSLYVAFLPFCESGEIQIPGY